MPAASRASPRRRLKTILTLSAAGLAAALIALGCAAACRPSWYRPAAPDYARLDADQRALVDLVDRIGAGLNRSEAVEIIVEEAQVNRWIAAQRELALPEAWSLPEVRPVVRFGGEGRMQVAILVRRGMLSAVATAELELVVDPELILVRLSSAKLGLVPLPTGWLVEAARAVSGGRLADVEWRPSAVRLRNNFVWENGRCRYRVRALTCSTGRVQITLTPR